MEELSGESQKERVTHISFVADDWSTKKTKIHIRPGGLFPSHWLDKGHRHHPLVTEETRSWTNPLWHVMKVFHKAPRHRRSLAAFQSSQHNSSVCNRGWTLPNPIGCHILNKQASNCSSSGEERCKCRLWLGIKTSNMFLFPVRKKSKEFFLSKPIVLNQILGAFRNFFLPLISANKPTLVQRNERELKQQFSPLNQINSLLKATNPLKLHLMNHSCRANSSCSSLWWNVKRKNRVRSQRMFHFF